MKYFYVIMFPILRPYYGRNIPDVIHSIHSTRKEAREKMERLGVPSSYIKRAYGNFEEINNEEPNLETWETMVYEAIKKKKPQV